MKVLRGRGGRFLVPKRGAPSVVDERADHNKDDVEEEILDEQG